MTMNPFWVSAPEQLAPEDVARLFVDVFTDLPKLKEAENTFVLGARGTGKSMMMRSLEPAVMLKAGKASSVASLPHLGVVVPLKQVEFGNPELGRLTGYAKYVVGEHLLCLKVLFHLVGMLESLGAELHPSDAEHVQQEFRALYTAAGGNPGILESPRPGAGTGPLANVRWACEQELMAVRRFYMRSPLAPSEEYAGALGGYLDMIVPFAMTIQRLASLPKVPLFVMLDDADNLPRHLQRVLNSWVSTRTTNVICLKISTQLGYATYRTMDNRIIESPHDFSVVNLTSLYTADSDKYTDRVREIVRKRLDAVGIATEVEEFFPFDQEQARRLEAIKDDIRAGRMRHPSDENPNARRGSARPRDDVTRYAVPTLMKELAGSSRSSHTFSYAGFRSLVDLSSGVIRWFLEPASRMYDQLLSEGSSMLPCSIPVALQDTVLVEWSGEFRRNLEHRAFPKQDDEVVEAEAEVSLHAFGHEGKEYEQLGSLLDGLGTVFRHFLLDESRSERRVFSIVLNGNPSTKLIEILELGVRMGYFQRTDLAAKATIFGRQPRFIMSRRLGPHYKLDISGYAAHLSVRAAELEVALSDHVAFARMRIGAGRSEISQPTLALDDPQDD